MRVMERHELADPRILTTVRTYCFRRKGIRYARQADCLDRRDFTRGGCWLPVVRREARVMRTQRLGFWVAVAGVSIIAPFTLRLIADKTHITGLERFVSYINREGAL